MQTMQTGGLPYIPSQSDLYAQSGYFPPHPHYTMHFPFQKIDNSHFVNNPYAHNPMGDTESSLSNREGSYGQHEDTPAGLNIPVPLVAPGMPMPMINPSGQPYSTMFNTFNPTYTFSQANFEPSPSVWPSSHPSPLTSYSYSQNAPSAGLTGPLNRYMGMPGYPPKTQYHMKHPFGTQNFEEENYSSEIQGRRINPAPPINMLTKVVQNTRLKDNDETHPSTSNPSSSSSMKSHKPQQHYQQFSYPPPGYPQFSQQPYPRYNDISMQTQQQDNNGHTQ